MGKLMLFGEKRVFFNFGNTIVLILIWNSIFKQLKTRIIDLYLDIV